MESKRTTPAVGDRVRFEFEGSQILGSVFVVDARGGGVRFGVKADEGTLYKHIPLNEVELAPAEGQ